MLNPFELLLVFTILGLSIVLFKKNRKLNKLEKEFKDYKDQVENEYP
jgi:hypothetical protein